MSGGNRWGLLSDYLIILEIWIDFWRIIHSSTSKGLYNSFKIQSFWVIQIPNFLFFFFFGLNSANFLNYLILFADMRQCQNTKSNQSWCFLKLVLLMHLQVKKWVLIISILNLVIAFLKVKLRVLFVFSPLADFVNQNTRNL